MNYFRSLKNSLIITVTSVVILLTCCSMAGYAIARLKGRLGGFLQIFFLAGMIVSAQMSIIPMYKVVNQVGIGNTVAAPIALYVTSALPFSIFLYTNFIKSGVPYSLEEAARIDGASIPFTFVRIVLPLTKPALSSLVITQGVPIWNDFFLECYFYRRRRKNTASDDAELYRRYGKCNPVEYAVCCLLFKCTANFDNLCIFTEIFRGWTDSWSGKRIKYYKLVDLSDKIGIMDMLLQIERNRRRR